MSETPSLPEESVKNTCGYSYPVTVTPSREPDESTGLHGNHDSFNSRPDTRSIISLMSSARSQAILIVSLNFPELYDSRFLIIFGLTSISKHVNMRFDISDQIR